MLDYLKGQKWLKFGEKLYLAVHLSHVFALTGSIERHDMAEGKVKWFNPDKGYGFIARDEGEDLFVHYSEIQGDGFKTLEENADVEFDITTGREGKLQASNVRLVG